MIWIIHYIFFLPVAIFRGGGRGRSHSRTVFPILEQHDFKFNISFLILVAFFMTSPFTSMEVCCFRNLCLVRQTVS